MLAIDLVFISFMFEEFICTRFTSLKLAVYRNEYLFFGWSVIIRTFRIRFSSLLVQNRQLDSDFFLVLKHPTFNSSLYFRPVEIVFECN